MLKQSNMKQRVDRNTIEFVLCWPSTTENGGLSEGFSCYEETL